MNQLNQILLEKFPKSEIVTLKYLTSKISMVSNVRVGNKKNRDFLNYDEVSLNYIDKHGFIYINDEAKIQEKASVSAINRQSLNYGDILMVQRGKTGKIGMVNKKEFYKKIIVGNNSMIRLQFSYEQLQESFHHFIFYYLQLPFVKEYLELYIPSSNSLNRKILNSTALSNLPVPLIKIEDREIFFRILSVKKQRILETEEIQRNIENLLVKYKEANENTLDDIINNNEHLSKLESDVESLENIFNLNREINKLLLKL